MQSKQQFCNLISRTISRAATAALAMAFVLVFMAIQAAMFAGTAYAQTVTFTFDYSCSDNCPPENLQIAYQVGQVASDVVPIATVNSDVPGYTQPVPITGGPYGGSLSWISSPATYVWTDQNGGRDAAYDNPGGSASIVGSVFGLPSGSTLLTASCFGGAGSYSTPKFGYPSFNGAINISSINPVILDNLGMSGLPNHGSGFLSDSFNGYPNKQFTVSVTFTPGVGTFNVLHSFTGGADGGTPTAGLTMDKAGNLYGVTGLYAAGTVFKLTYKGSGWVFTPLYSFQGGNDGANPEARVTVGPDGNLYGTTAGGGGSGWGTVFKLQPSPTACKTALCPWTETVLYRFSGGSDGGYPLAELVFDHAGNLYGTATYGGDQNCYDGCGVVYKLTPSGGGWTESVLYSFTGGTDGSNPEAGLIFDPAGNLYGTASGGGSNGNGTVYQLTPSGSGWTEKTIYSFTGGSDGGTPQASPVLDPAGNLYGTSTAAVYELSPSGGGWTFSVLYNLTGPTGALFLDASGNLYGGDPKGGYYKGGSIFKLAPSNGSWTPTLLYQFTGYGDGDDPIGVVRDAKGNLYGTTGGGGTYYGGVHGNGVVWEITP
jgi:uncharacterized repeat protein (TIGR03803 family)